MNQRNSIAARTRITANFALSVVLCFVLSGEAFAQQQSTTVLELSPKKAEAAWRLQVKGLSEELHLATEEQAKLLNLYIAARKSHQDAENKLAATESQRSKYRAASAELSKREYDRLTIALKDVLTDEQVVKAIESLGTFSSRWDRYVDTLASYELDDHKMNAAMKLVRVYIVDHGKELRKARSGGGRLSPSTSAQLKNTLDTGLAKLLSEEQYSDWRNKSAFRGAGGGRSSEGPANAKQPDNRKPANRKG